MTTRRRLTAAIALGVLAIAGLSACRSSPSVAAYVGSTTYSNETVDKMYDQVQTAVAEAARAAAADAPSPQPQPPGQPTPSPTPDSIPSPITKRDVVQTLVGRDMVKAIAEAKRVEPIAIPEENRAQILQQTGLPAGTDYSNTYLQYLGYLEALLRAATATTPADEDLRQVYDRLLEGGLQEPGLTFEDFKANVPPQNLRLVAQLGQVADELQAQVGKDNVVVNPRYAPAALSLLQVPDQQGRPYPLFLVPLNAKTASPAVVDVS